MYNNKYIYCTNKICIQFYIEFIRVAINVERMRLKYLVGFMHKNSRHSNIFSYIVEENLSWK